MTKRKDVLTAAARKRLKEQIAQKHGDKLISRRINELCHQCAWWFPSPIHCQYDIFPITLDGSQCPYFIPATEA